MTSINLLPWREELREERKKDFIATLVLVIIVAGLIVFLVDRYFSSAINTQNRRNQYLNEQIAIVDQQVAEIRELRQQKQALTERMGVIQELQGTRPVIVRLFDELVRNLPEGVYYESINRTGNSIRLEGVAESNSHISALMRELESSAWFASPKLQQVTADNSGGQQDDEINRGRFLLTVAITRPDQEQSQ